VAGDARFDERQGLHGGGTHIRPSPSLEALAEMIVAEIQPAWALDAGCGTGELVAALRDRGVEAFGVDLSEWAIRHVRDDIRPHCWVGSILDPLPSRYDLIVCAEVLELLTASEAETAVAMLSQAADQVLVSFSSDYWQESADERVRQPEAWAGLFAQHGLVRDDASLCALAAPEAPAQVMHFRRCELSVAQVVPLYERTIRLLHEANDSRHMQALATFDEIHTWQEGELNAARARIATLEGRLATAEWRLKSLESSHGVRLIRLARASLTVLQSQGLRGLARRVGEWTGQRHQRRSLGDIAPPARPVTSSVAFRDQGERAAAADYDSTAVYFLSDCPAAMRYRCDHQAQQLGMLGCTCEVGAFGQVDLDDILVRCQCFVLHRVPHDATVERFIAAARELGKPVIFDTDDLVFDTNAAPYIAALEDLAPDVRRVQVEGMSRYRKTLLLCDAVLVSTQPLLERVREVCERAFVVPNAVSIEMVRGADAALAAKRLGGGDASAEGCVIGYFSGTATHNRDFLEAADAILWALETYPFVLFRVVGDLRLDERFDRFTPSRVERIPLHPWQDLPHLYAQVDINIAPLEPNNPFTDGKSCVKYLEAALLGVPTIASPRPDFVRVMRHGDNGMLANSPDEWRAALQALIESVDMRRELGQRAFDQVRERHTTAAQARSFDETMRTIVSAHKESRAAVPLTLNWVAGRPVAGDAGRYHMILRLANDLAGRGHMVRVCVEASGCPHESTLKRIRADMERQIGSLLFEVSIGQDNIARADVSIATDYRTADLVARHTKSAFKCSFVQDFEPERSETDAPEHRAAMRTYRLPLRHLCLGPRIAAQVQQASGQPAEIIDVAVDDHVYCSPRPLEERTGPPQILYYARPNPGRHAFNLGIEALRRVKRRRPEVEIVLVGCTDDELGSVPFEMTNLGLIEPKQFASALNSSQVLLCSSPSRPTMVEVAGMACGAAVVSVDGSRGSESAAADPGRLIVGAHVDAIADTLVRLIDNPTLRARIASEGVREMSARHRDPMVEQFERALMCLCWARSTGIQQRASISTPDPTSGSVCASGAIGVEGASPDSQPLSSAAD